MSQATIDMTATGRNIERLLKEKNISVSELTRSLGFSTTNAVYKWIRGETLPTLDNLVSLSVIIDVSIDEIIIKRI